MSVAMPPGMPPQPPPGMPPPPPAATLPPPPAAPTPATPRKTPRKPSAKFANEKRAIEKLIEASPRLATLDRERAAKKAALEEPTKEQIAARKASAERFAREKAEMKRKLAILSERKHPTPQSFVAEKAAMQQTLSTLAERRASDETLAEASRKDEAYKAALEMEAALQEAERVLRETDQQGSAAVVATRDGLVACQAILQSVAKEPAVAEGALQVLLQRMSATEQAPIVPPPSGLR